MENDNVKNMKTSTDEPRWAGVVNIEEILSKLGPEGCHELAEELTRVANADMQQALEQAYNEAHKPNSLEEEVWFEYPKEPFLNTAVVVELDNSKLAIAQLDENYNRKCWLIQGMGGLFWRSMFEKIIKWRWMTADEMLEYHENRTLKIIENDKT